MRRVRGGDYGVDEELELEADGLMHRHKRRKRISLHEDRDDPLAFGLRGPQLKQGRVVIDTRLAHVELQKRTSYLSSGRGGIMRIPGGMGPEDSVYDVRIGDALCTFKSHLERLGHGTPEVFVSLNGIDYSPYATSDDLEQELVVMGFASDTHKFGSVSKNKFLLSTDAVMHGTIINTGPNDIIAGDLVSIGVPYFTRDPLPALAPGGAVGAPVRPDAKWVERHSGSRRTRRVPLQIRRTTAHSMYRVMKPVLYKLAAHTRILEEQEVGGPGISVFPTARMIPTSDVFDARRFSSMEAAAMGKWNDVCIFALTVVRELLRSNEIRGPDGVAPDAVLDRVGALLGFTASGDPNPAFIRRVLYNYLYEFLPRNIKTEMDVLDRARPMANPRMHEILRKGASVSQYQLNRLIMGQMSKVIGKATSGGRKGRPFEIDVRTTVM